MLKQLVFTNFNFPSSSVSYSNLTPFRPMLLCPAPSVCPVSSTHSETESGTKFKLGVRYTCSPRQTVADRAILDQITPGQSHPQDTQNIDTKYRIIHERMVVSSLNLV